MKKHACHICLFVLSLLPLSALGSGGGEDNKIPFKSEILSGYDEVDVRNRCDAADLQPMEGIWYYPDERLTVVIERYDDKQKKLGVDYRAVLVSSNDMSLLPGTVIAYFEESADKNKYKMWIYSEQKESELENPQMCVASLNDAWNELLVERSEVKMKVRVNFSRFLPKLLKGVSLVPNKKGVVVPEGFRKIYPDDGEENGADDVGIRYL